MKGSLLKSGILLSIIFLTSCTEDKIEAEVNPIDNRIGIWEGVEIVESDGEIDLTKLATVKITEDSVCFLGRNKFKCFYIDHFDSTTIYLPDNIDMRCTAKGDTLTDEIRWRKGKRSYHVYKRK